MVQSMNFHSMCAQSMSLRYRVIEDRVIEGKRHLNQEEIIKNREYISNYTEFNVSHVRVNGVLPQFLDVFFLQIKIQGTVSTTEYILMSSTLFSAIPFAL